MKRELSFRAYHGKPGTGTMKYNVGVHPFMIFRISDLDGYTEHKLDDNTGDLVVCPSEYHVMQSTGLKDKNGNMIFEGDVVKDEKGNSHTIIFRNGLGFGSGQGTNEQIGWYYGEYALSRFSALEVTGNIHELNQTT